MKRLLITASLMALVLLITARLDAQLYRVPKQAQAASARLEAAMSHIGTDQTIPVMVYFTDKGVFTDSDFRVAADARRSQLSVRALKRRAKMGLTSMSFEDLPVSTLYAEQVRKFGAKLRQRLNWFNAATFDMTADQALTAAQLGCVQRMDLVVTLRAPLEPEAIPEIAPAPAPAPKSHLLNYGPSLTQDSLINAVVCHDSGYSGEGVMMAMFDSGFRKGHQAFDSIRMSGRLVDEWDFYKNTALVDSESHGTGTWSEAGGYVPGKLIGPAYKATWAIYRTEVVAFERNVEEDYWAAALQRADSAGVDVVSSSLGYFTFDAGQQSYTYADMNGVTAICSQAAHHAAALGIIVCNAMGNEGPSTGSISAPADADSILSVGNVDSLGTINPSSSRGPTYDARAKPEVCAQGTNIYWASWSGIANYTHYATGTSCATPLVAGACALVLQAHHSWTPMQVRQALMMTASKHTSPDNSTYGWGIINTWAAIKYDSATGTGQNPTTEPARSFSLWSYPNPARSAATIEFTISRAGTAQISLYDALGRRVRAFPSILGRQGRNDLRWDGKAQDGSAVAAGVYFCRVNTTGGSGTIKVVLVR